MVENTLSFYQQISEPQKRVRQASKILIALNALRVQTKSLTTRKTVIEDQHISASKMRRFRLTFDGKPHRTLLRGMSICRTSFYLNTGCCFAEFEVKFRPEIPNGSTWQILEQEDTSCLRILQTPWQVKSRDL